MGIIITYSAYNLYGKELLINNSAKEDRHYCLANVVIVVNNQAKYTAVTLKLNPGYSKCTI